MKRLLYGMILAAAPLLAAEGGEAGKPDLEIWKWLNFFILFGLLGYFAVKQGGPALKARSTEIREGLAAGERAKAEADARAREVSAKLANLETEVASMRTTAKAELEREAARIKEEFERELARLQRQSEMEIESAGKVAKFELQSFAAKLAIDLAEQKIKTRMTPDVQSGLLTSFLKDFPANAGSMDGRQ